MCALRLGLNVLVEEEGVRVREIRGHGGLFKVPEVGQRLMAAATRIPVSVLETAGEGGAWGIALLAAFAAREQREVPLVEFLNGVFVGKMGAAMAASEEEQSGFERYLQRYVRGLAIERAAVESLPHVVGR